MTKKELTKVYPIHQIFSKIPKTLKWVCRLAHKIPKTPKSEYNTHNDPTGKIPKPLTGVFTYSSK